MKHLRAVVICAPWAVVAVLVCWNGLAMGGIAAELRELRGESVKLDASRQIIEYFYSVHRAVYSRLEVRRMLRVAHDGWLIGSAGIREMKRGELRNLRVVNAGTNYEQSYRVSFAGEIVDMRSVIEDLRCPLQCKVKESDMVMLLGSNCGCLSGVVTQQGDGTATVVLDYKCKIPVEPANE